MTNIELLHHLVTLANTASGTYPVENFEQGGRERTLLATGYSHRIVSPDETVFSACAHATKKVLCPGQYPATLNDLCMGLNSLVVGEKFKKTIRESVVGNKFWVVLPGTVIRKDENVCALWVRINISNMTGLMMFKEAVFYPTREPSHIEGVLLLADTNRL